MTNINRAVHILADAFRPGFGVGADAIGRDLAHLLADAGLLMPDNGPNAPEPQIIRTLDGIDALDPETLLIEHARNGGYPLSKASQWMDSETERAWEGAKKDLPAVVIATGDQVRAARQALDGIE